MPKRLDRWYGPSMLGLSVVILIIGLAVMWFATETHTWPVFDDLRIYLQATERLTMGGDWFLPHQLQGPYDVQHGDVLYPPVTAWFFAPWLFLPPVSFVLIPLGVLGIMVRRWRPSPWAWPLMAACLAFPATGLYFVFANPALWIAAFVAAGLWYRWPAALVVLKPSVAPFALIGVASRAWWATMVVVGALSLPVLSETLLYPGVILRADLDLAYSFANVPLLLVPVLAWLARTRSGPPLLGR